MTIERIDVESVTHAGWLRDFWQRGYDAAVAGWTLTPRGRHESSYEWRSRRAGYETGKRSHP